MVGSAARVPGEVQSATFTAVRRLHERDAVGLSRDVGASEETDVRGVRKLGVANAE